jgi:hypothetical protein
MMGVETKIGNSHLLTGIFGRWPSFHDAEVLHIGLNPGERTPYGPWLDAIIHVFEMTAQIDNGAYVLRNHSAVTLRFREICELKLDGFNHQNVLAGLRIIDISDRQLERIRFEVFFDGIFGVSANLQCHSIDVEAVKPYIPARD